MRVCFFVPSKDDQAVTVKLDWEKLQEHTVLKSYHNVCKVMLKKQGIPKISTRLGHSQGARLLGMHCTKHWGWKKQNKTKNKYYLVRYSHWGLSSWENMEKNCLKNSANNALCAQFMGRYSILLITFSASNLEIFRIKEPPVLIHDSRPVLGGYQLLNIPADDTGVESSYKKNHNSLIPATHWSWNNFPGTNFLRNNMSVFISPITWRLRRIMWSRKWHNQLPQTLME